jgi:hypothetical protein
VAIAAPAIFGFTGATTTDAIGIGSFFLPGVFAAGGRPHVDGNWIWQNLNKPFSPVGAPPGFLPAIAGVFAAGIVTNTLIAGTHFPLNAKRLRVATWTRWTIAAVTDYSQLVAYASPDGVTLGTQLYVAGEDAYSVVGTKNINAVFDVPVLRSNDGVAVTPNLVVLTTPNVTGGAHVDSFIWVLAYQL